MTYRPHLQGAILAVLAVLTLHAVPARAQLVDEENVGRLTIGGGIGLLVPSMAAVNDNISVVNPFLRREEVRTMDRIHSGLLTHMDIRYRLGNTPKEEVDDPTSFLDRVTVGFSWGAVAARSQINDVTRVRTRFYSRATTYYPYLLYHLPFAESAIPRAQFTVGGGPIFLQSGTVEWSLDDQTSNIFLPEGDVSELAGKAAATATGTGFVLQGGGSYMLNSTFSVSVDLGYRSGKLSNLDLTEVTGQDKRFPGDDDNDPTNDVVRRPGDWSVIDFFYRDVNAVYKGRVRSDSGQGGCDPNIEDGIDEECPLYYTGGDLDVDFSGPFLTFSIRVHF